MKICRLLLILLLATPATSISLLDPCPKPSIEWHARCCLAIGENYTTEVSKFADICASPYFKIDLFCCAYKKDVNYTTETTIDLNGTQYLVYKGLFYGDIIKKIPMHNVDPTEDPKLVELSKTDITLSRPQTIKDYGVSLTQQTPPQQTDSTIIIVLGAVILIIILIIAWRLGKDDEDENEPLK
jgi:hypothetical protein